MYNYVIIIDNFFFFGESHQIYKNGLHRFQNAECASDNYRIIN